MALRNKFMSRIRPIGLAIALGCSIAAPAQATTLSNLLTFDGPVDIDAFPTQGGGEDRLQDDSLTAIENRDGSVITLPDGSTLPTFTSGDTIWGVATLSDIQASGLPNYTVGVNEQIAIIFALDYTGATGTGILGPATDPTLATLCGAVCGGAGLGATSVAVVLSTTDATDDPLNYTTANFTTMFNSGLWTWEMTVGLEDDSFFAFVDGGLAGSTERSALAITSQAFTADWLPVDVLDFAGGLHTNDLTLDDGDVQYAGEDAVSRGWAFQDQAAFYLNPTAVPEPSSLALMGIALAGFGGAARRRRKQQQ